MKRYSRNSNVITGRVKDELVMMDIGSESYFGLDAVATRIWDLLEEPKSAVDLCSILTEEYEVTAEECLKDVSELLEEMERMGIVVSDGE